MSLKISQTSFLQRKVRKFLAPPAEYDWVMEAEWARIQQKPIKAQVLLYGIAVTIIALIVWANMAVIDEVARGQGKVVPSQKLQIVQSFDGGIVQDILVSEGEQVTAGEVLVRVDPTRFVSSLQENASQQQGLRAKADRLQALIDDRPLQFSDTLKNLAEDIKQGEEALYQSNLQELQQLQSGYHSRILQKQQDQAAYKAEFAQYERSKVLIDKELAVTRPLLESGAVSTMDIIRLERQQVELNGSLQRAMAAIQRSESAINEEQNAKQEARLKVINQWRRELAEATSKLAVLAQSKTGLEDVVAQSELRSPINGTVQRLLFNTLGGVISPGSQVVEIVPSNDQLIVEAKISPKDIAFIRHRQPAILKFSAYDFAIYGGMKAEVDHISADTITDEKDNTFYIVRLRTVTPVGDTPLEILPGMTAQVDIITGERSVMDFLLKPILNAASSALGER